MFHRSDRYLGIGFMLFSIFMYYISTTWPMNFSSDPAGPSAIPKILCVGLCILGLILTVGGFGVKAKGNKVLFTRQELIITGALTIASIIYINILPVIGYLLATPLLIASILWFVGTKKVKTIVLVSIIGTLVLFLLFYSLLQINLPLGFTKKFISSIVPRL